MNKNIIEQAKTQFEMDFSKEGYMEKRTADNEHLRIIMEQLSFEQYNKVLDLGTGSGFLAFPLAKTYPQIHVIGLDIAPQVLERNRKKVKVEQLNNLEFIVYDGIKFPFPDNSFTHIVTRYAIHHFPDINKCFEEMYRVLKPGGMLFISDPTPNENDIEGFVDAFMQLKPDGHVKFYTETEYTCLAQSHGFERENCFFTQIRFPSERRGGFQKIRGDYSDYIIDGYNIEIIDEEIYITERVINLLLRK